MSNPEGKVPPEVTNYRFPEEAGMATVADTNETVKPKYQVGQVVKNWGLPNEFNEPYQEALQAGWITEKCELTEKGVEHLLSGKTEVNQPKLAITRTEASELAKPKYEVGQMVKNWGLPGEFNEEYQEALHSGWITEKCELTEKGVSHLLNKDTGLLVEPKSEPEIEMTEELIEEKKEIKQSPQKLTFPVSSTRRMHKLEASMGDLGKKKLLDSIQDVLEKRGYNVLGVSAELNEESINGEEIYTLHIEFGQSGGNGNDKKQKKTLRLVGSEESLVESLSENDFNFPTTTDVKKIRRAFRR